MEVNAIMNAERNATQRKRIAISIAVSVIIALADIGEQTALILVQNFAQRNAIKLLVTAKIVLKDSTAKTAI